MKGKPSLIFMPLTMWSHQHLISKKEDSLYKRKHIWKISTFSLITAVLGNQNRMLFYLIFVSRGLRDKGLEGGERPVRRSLLCLLFSCSLSLFPLHAGQPPGAGQANLQCFRLLGRPSNYRNSLRADWLRGPWALTDYLNRSQL